MTDLTIYDAPWTAVFGKTAIRDKNGAVVCMLMMPRLGNFDSVARLELRAELIAAAPDLLSAAEIALEYLSSTLNGDPDDAATTAWNVLAAAIATARG